MKSISKYFTPPLMSGDRDRLYECLGFGEFSLWLLESCDGVILHSRKYIGLTEEPLLGDPRSLKGFHHPFISCEFLGERLKKSPLISEKTLWEELFPFPISLLASALTNKTELRVEMTPVGLWIDFKRLWEVLTLFEARLANSELNLLWVQGKNAGIPILFHYVRRKRVRLGTSKELEETGERHLKNSSDIQQLTDLFRVRTIFYPLDLRSVASCDGPPVRNLTRALEGLLQKSGTQEVSPCSFQELGL